MLRDLVAWVLNNHLGKYVENLNTAQLSIALLSGEVELENLPIRRDALRNIGLPVQALSGTIGKVKLQIPVRQFRSAPWCIFIEDIYIVVGPINIDEWNAEAEEQAHLDYKLSRLNQLEAIWRAQREANPNENNYYVSSYSGWMNYGTSLVTNIVENLELKIRNVHIRYEDSVTVTGNRIACGLTIESLSARSCDSNWIPGYTAMAGNQCCASFKLVELDEMSFYWDRLSISEVFGDMPASDLSSSIKKWKLNCQHTYVIRPVSAKAKLQRDRSELPLRTRSRPRIICDLTLDEVGLKLSDWQYCQMIECIHGLDRIARYRNFRLMRPKCSVHDEPKAWWIYACRCLGYRRIYDRHKLRTMTLDNIKYIEIYTAMLANTNDILATKDKALKDNVEKDRSFDELKFLRQICMSRIQNPVHEKAVMTERKGIILQWFPQWWGSHNNPTLNQNDDLFEEIELPKNQTQLEDEILNALSDSVDNNSLMKRDAVFGKFDFILKRGTLDICSMSEQSENQPMVQLQFENLVLNVESRPRSASYLVGLSLGSVHLKDLITAQSEYPDLIRPQDLTGDLFINLRYLNQRSRLSTPILPLFQLQYEQRPLSCTADHRLSIKSQSLDIVYNTDVIEWIIEFITKPYKYEDDILSNRPTNEEKSSSKIELIKNWENYLETNLSQRKTWNLEIDIAAPQIIFVENFTQKHSTIVVIDFGRLQIHNQPNGMNSTTTNRFGSDYDRRSNEDEEAFMTPCSTLNASATDSPTLCSALSDFPDVALNERVLYDRIYEKYNISLTDLQVLICKGRDGWSFASAKGSSTLHILDRFSIAIQIERRIVYTSDPQFPSLTLYATLPKLVAHINEHKVAALRIMLTAISALKTTDSKYQPPTNRIESTFQDTNLTDIVEHPESNKLIILQFAIDHMALELQSEGKSIAELQVTGVKAGLTKRPEDTSFTLSVHGLLLVDALQSFGSDFELLIASHRHVGMDSVSGSLKQSEPCSPISPASPDPTMDCRPTSPHTISNALHNLQRNNSATWNATDQSDALIIVEIHVISGGTDNAEQLHIANIQFNNLDIIANPETIVELIGFANRILPKSIIHDKPYNIESNKSMKSFDSTNQNDDTSPAVKTEITFDFHRLNVLVLRALNRDNYTVGRKVGTLTMCEARIHATVNKIIDVEGSLGGLQILDLTPEGVAHQRILSVGKDPLTDPPPHLANDLLNSLTHEVYGQRYEKEDVMHRRALSFHITKDFDAFVDIKIRMASVWYTHCAQFMQELSLCASEFKHYLKVLATSIRNKAADMALELVSFNVADKNPLDNDTIKFDKQIYQQTKSTVDLIRLDMVLDTPVLVIPRSVSSPHVFVAHLGKIKIRSNQFDGSFDRTTLCTTELDTNSFDDKSITGTVMNDTESVMYTLDVRNINLYTLDTTKRKCFGISALPRAEEFYSCTNDAIIVLHDTGIHTEFVYTESPFSNNFTMNEEEMIKPSLEISGHVVKPLQLSLSRVQYQQLIETIENMFEDGGSQVPTSIKMEQLIETDLLECGSGVNSDLMKRLSSHQFDDSTDSETLPSNLETKVKFKLPDLAIELCNEMNRPIIEILFNDFQIDYDKHNPYQTNVQVSLKSLVMNDLLQPTDSKNRSMLLSSSPSSDQAQTNPSTRLDNSTYSQSCPNFNRLYRADDLMTGSLPDCLTPQDNFSFIKKSTNKNYPHPKSYPETPPPSPQQFKTTEDQLVLYTVQLTDSRNPNFDTQYKSLNHSSTIDFNSLDLIISVQSWFALMDFFGLITEDKETMDSKETLPTDENLVEQKRTGHLNSELEVSIRSLTIVLRRQDYDLAKANISNAQFIVSKYGEAKTVEGRLGSVSLFDLTKYGDFYRERFLSSGSEVLNFIYRRDGAKFQRPINIDAIKPDAKLKLRMSSIQFVYTKRFITEIQMFFKDFEQLEMPVLRKIKPTDLDHHRPVMKLLLDIKAGSPMVVLPLSSKHTNVIVADLGEFSLKNKFVWAGEPSVNEHIESREIVDVMNVDLVNTDLFAGKRYPEYETLRHVDVAVSMGSYLIVKDGPNLLNQTVHLKLIVERNVDTRIGHQIPDISVRGTLSKLEAVLDLDQFKLIKGFLSSNLGECIDDVYLQGYDYYAFDSRINLTSDSQSPIDSTVVWTNISVSIDLQGVSVHLVIPITSELKEPLACINFIKSSLKIDSFSDGSQDIDLVSQDIVVTDTRVSVSSDTAPKDACSYILQTTNSTRKSDSDFVQAEVHSRKRGNIVKYTVLLNNMRIMAILDWLESVRDFLSQNPDDVFVYRSDVVKSHETYPMETLDEQIELIVNITDSELVFVEKAHECDTNAVILKSTTVLSYRQFEQKELSINLNNLEVFSCVLGFEDETALSIIDPITINMDIKHNRLDVQLQKQLSIRLSYNDVKMFSLMFQSLPKQTKKANEAIQTDGTEPNEVILNKLTALGFSTSDCRRALLICNNELDESALWLTQNVSPIIKSHSTVRSSLEINTIEVNANCVSICVIDDCKDADVPLVELFLTEFGLKIDLNSNEAVNNQTSFVKTGKMNTLFTSYYYNRALSGWEPFIEEWKFELLWHFWPGPTLYRNLNLDVKSDNILKINCTSSFIELCHLVHKNWIQDFYYNDTSGGVGVTTSSSGYRRRTPFIPFAIKNDSGSRLWFTTLVTSPGIVGHTEVKPKTERWTLVESGTSYSFTFANPTKQRHLDTHKQQLHQIAVRVAGWSEVGPVSVDQVGIFFRHARPELVDITAKPRARIVFSVSMEGSAQKVVTVRSALRVRNQLAHPVVLNMEHTQGYLSITDWPDGKTEIIDSGSTYSIPLSHVHAFLYVRPLGHKQDNQQLSENKRNVIYRFWDKSVHWRNMIESVDVAQEMRTCRSNREKGFRIVAAIHREPYPIKDSVTIPGHLIVLWPPLRLHNLLPCDLLYKLPSGSQGRITSSETANIHDIDFDTTIDISVTLDSYPGSAQLSIPVSTSGIFETRIRLTDIKNRPLMLRACIQLIKGYGIQITISASFWLVNRTGLPLIFRQEGVSVESAGQFEENEEARLVTPFMFSFSDPDASPTITVRLGHRYGSNPPWCQSFNVHKDILHRHLQSASSSECFIIGVEVRRGRGRYAKTSIVTFSPRFQLYNQSSYKLQYAQRCFATSLTNTLAKATFIEAVPGCNLPFHWPRLDRDLDMCIRLPDLEDCCWSGAIPIRETHSLYLNIRQMSGVMHFIRLEIILQGATYFVLFGDAQSLPPPIRIDNYSDISLKFYQFGCHQQHRTTIRPHSSLAYVLDEPMGSHSIVMDAPGGISYNYSLREFGMSHILTYENFIYIAFSGTFPQDDSPLIEHDEYDIDCQQLVLTVLDDGRVILARKEFGNRAQLWRMNQDKQLEHEGSSPPTEPGKSINVSTRYVLDLAKTPQPLHSTALVVRPQNRQRRLTQTWHFTDEGRLMCEHANMCVQSRDGIFGLRPGGDAVLGLIISDSHHNVNVVPIEQSIERQKLRPGSGYLSVTVIMDGPIKTIQIKDVKSQNNLTLALDPRWPHHLNITSKTSSYDRQLHRKNLNTLFDEFHFNFNLSKGIGLSLVSKSPCEELIYISLEDITVELVTITSVVYTLDLSVANFQIDNQIFETPCPVMLYKIQTGNSGSDSLPALNLTVKLLPSPNSNAIIIEHFIFSVRPMAVYLEERIILKLIIFFGLADTQSTILPDESDYEAQSVATKIFAANATRYYFGDLQIVASQIRLSVVTASKLSPHLSEIKKSLGLTLIQFADAIIDFKKFTDRYHFEPLEVYIRAIKSHYKQELKWQAASILGSVDFLGNPFGLASDLSEGVSGLIFEGSVKSLVKNLTHGISNSTAKLAETISDGLGRVVLDEQDIETRHRILEVPTGTNSSGDHLVAGMKSFGFGLLGGMTSIVKHTYVGAQNDGIQGLLSGLGRGIAGTVTKPVIGVLDLASETANAVRETSKSSHRTMPERKRLPRCVTGAPGGLLPPYSHIQSKGQQNLFLINKRNFNEHIIAYEPYIYNMKESNLRLLVSSENVWVFSRNEESITIILTYHLSELLSCHPVSKTSTDGPKTKRIKYYIELCSNSSARAAPSSTQDGVKRPRVRCQTEEMSQRASRHINYAKSLYEEREHTLNYESNSI